MEILFLFGGSIFVLSILFYLFFLVWKKKYKLNQKTKTKVKQILKKIDKKTPEQQIIAYDKLLDFILKNLNFKGTSYEKIKKYPFFVNLNNLKKAHQLRNQIAHKVDFNLSEKTFLKAKKTFQTEIDKFL
jgi:hypothetical protein